MGKEKWDLNKFNSRIVKKGNVYIDSWTGKEHYCPHDLGLEFTLKDCIGNRCESCWEEARAYLKLIEDEKNIIRI